MKLRLIIDSQNDTIDLLKFNSLDDLLKFINELTVERLIDNNRTTLKYDIIVEE